MSTITAILQPDPDGTLHLPLPAGWGHQPIRVTAELELMPLNAENAKKCIGNQFKGFGCLRGQILISQDFDKPVEEFKDYES